MTEIRGSKDCGNSPKNKFVQDVIVALEIGKATPEDFSEYVIWEGISEEPINGRTALFQELAERATPIAVNVEHAISHGKVGAANGEIILGNGHRRRFSHVLEFTSAKANRVAVIKTYA